MALISNGTGPELPEGGLGGGWASNARRGPTNAFNAWAPWNTPAGQVRSNGGWVTVQRQMTATDLIRLEERRMAEEQRIRNNAAATADARAWTNPNSHTTLAQATYWGYPQSKTPASRVQPFGWPNAQYTQILSDDMLYAFNRPGFVKDMQHITAAAQYDDREEIRLQTWWEGGGTINKDWRGLPPWNRFIGTGYHGLDHYSKPIMDQQRSLRRHPKWLRN